jgi:hypothetical protein
MLVKCLWLNEREWFRLLNVWFFLVLTFSNFLNIKSLSFMTEDYFYLEV